MMRNSIDVTENMQKVEGFTSMMRWLSCGTGGGGEMAFENFLQGPRGEPTCEVD